FSCEAIISTERTSDPERPQPLRQPASGVRSLSRNAPEAPQRGFFLGSAAKSGLFGIGDGPKAICRSWNFLAAQPDRPCTGWKASAAGWGSRYIRTIFAAGGADRGEARP